MPACKLLVSVVMLGLIAPVAVSAEPNLLDPSLSDAEVIEGIRSHWKERAEGVTSLALDVETELMWWVDLQEVEGLDKRDPTPPLAPFAERKPSRIPVRWQLRYYVEQDKVAFHHKLLNPDQNSSDMRFVLDSSVAFDGERTINYSATPDVLSVATVDVGKRASRATTANTNVLPIVLWRDAEQMLRVGRWNTAKIEVIDRQIEVEGRPCIRLALKQPGGGAKPPIGWLDVDPARESAPVRFQHFQAGRLESSIEIVYEDQAEGPVPTGWTYTRFPKRKEETGTTVYARVTTAKLNEDVADENFEVPLPAGTLVREKEGKVEREYTIGSENPGE